MFSLLYKLRLFKGNLHNAKFKGKRGSYANWSWPNETGRKENKDILSNFIVRF